jgi:tetratricopeptide (TPR) repeat protein
MDAIAMSWDAIATKDIARKVRMESKAVAAQLKILEQNNLIHAILADRKNKLYMITERFFNIWYLMRCGKKKSREQVRFLVRFLEEWCSPELAESLSPSDREIVSQAFSLAAETNDFEAAVRKLQEIRRQDGAVWVIYGVLFWQFANDLEKAEDYFIMAAEKGHAGAMYNLANLYREERKDLDMAEKYYLMAVEKGNADAMNGLAWLYFINKKAKEDAVKLAGQSVELSRNVNNFHTAAVCLLWNDRYDESLKAFQQFLGFEPFDAFESDITIYLVFLLAKKQHHLLLDLFNDEQYRLKERFKPVYYVLMHRMQDEYPKEFKKMGEELTQTVEEILAKADKMAEDYA